MRRGLALNALTRQPLIVTSAFTFSLTVHVVAAAATVWLAARPVPQRSASIAKRNGRPVPAASRQRPVDGETIRAPHTSSTSDDMAGTSSADLTAKPVLASAVNEAFESDALAASRIDRSGRWFVYANGSDANDADRLLYRDITLDGWYQLHLTLFDVGEEQQFRIDLVSPSAPTASSAKEHVLATVFPARCEPAEVTFDLLPWAGETVRLRLVSDVLEALRTSIDNVRFERITP